LDTDDDEHEDDGAEAAAEDGEADEATPITLTRTLIQALHSSDARLLETCLAHTRAQLILQTVRRLPPQLSVPLLNACVERLNRGARGAQAKGGGGAAGTQRAVGLVRWVKTVLVVHSGHLLTIPDLVARLAGLHATLTARAALQEPLRALSGRLDFVLQQMELRAVPAPAPLARGGASGKSKEKSRKVHRYVEGESEEEDVTANGAMHVEVEEGSEIGSIEDVELGGASSEGEDDDEEEDDEDYEDGEDEDDEGDESPRPNGFIDDEAEESEDDSEDDSE